MRGLKLAHLRWHRKLSIPDFPLLSQRELKKRCSAICEPQDSKQAEISIHLSDLALPGSGYSSVFPHIGKRDMDIADCTEEVSAHGFNQKCRLIVSNISPLNLGKSPPMPKEILVLLC